MNSVGITSGVLTTITNRQIAFVRHCADNTTTKRAGVMFLGGFRSDMLGTKATFLENWCKDHAHNFIKFDYSGHGESSEKFENGCISDWTNDALEVLDKLTSGPQILVGSSMGGWISLLIGKRRPTRCKALIGIAAAPDFTENSFWANFDEKNRVELLQNGFVVLPSEYSDEPYIITKKLIEDGRSNLVMDKPLDLPFPVRLLQGMKDTEVHYSEATKIAANMVNEDVNVFLLKSADHQFSSPKCLSLLKQTIEEFL